jgi:hypothetical protein
MKKFLIGLAILGIMVSSAFASVKLDDKIISIADGDKGTGVTYYTYFNAALEDKTYFALYVSPEATTITIEGRLDGPNTTDALSTWVDLTKMFTADATITTNTGVIADTPIGFNRYRIKALTTSATNHLYAFLTRFSQP